MKDVLIISGLCLFMWVASGIVYHHFHECECREERADTVSKRYLERRDEINRLEAQIKWQEDAIKKLQELK